MGKLKVRFFDYNDSDIIVIKDGESFREVKVAGIWEEDPILADRIEEGNVPVIAVLGLNPEYMATMELNPIIGNQDFDDHVVSVIVNTMVKYSKQNTWWYEDIFWPKNVFVELDKHFDRHIIERTYWDNGVEFLEGFTNYWQLK
jgi:hypothetical protein